MTTTITIDTVTTEDAAPIVAPHRVSRVTGFTLAHVLFHGTSDLVAIGPDVDLVPDVPTLGPDTTLELDGQEMTDGPVPGDVQAPLLGWAIKLGGADVASGTTLTAKAACGAAPVSPRRVCGAVKIASGIQVAKDVSSTDLNSGDTSYTINAYMQTQKAGWA